MLGGGGGGKKGGQKGERDGEPVECPPLQPRSVPAAAVADAVATTSKSPAGGGAGGGEMRERKHRKAEKVDDDDEKKATPPPSSQQQQKSSGPTVWFALKKSLHCRSSASDVHDPATAKARAAAAAASGGGSTTNSSSNSTSSNSNNNNNLGSILTRKTARSGCSRSIANLRDVIHGSKRHMERPPSCSPRSIGSSEFLNPITHEVILTGTCELKIHSGFDLTGGGGGGGGSNYGGIGGIGALGVLGGPTYLGTLRPGTPGPGGHLWGTAANATPSRKPPGLPLSPGAAGIVNGEGKEMNSPLGSSALSSAVLGGIGFHRASSRARASLDSEPNGGGRGGGVSCHKCGEQFGKWEAAEAHHVSKHAVTELVEGDSSRKIVEIICRTSWQKSETNCARIERVLKVHNTQKTLSRFEEYREIVKLKASKLPKKHPRCLADGNELLRFYGTTLACPLGTGGSSSLCGSDKCSVCRIIRNGFSTREMKSGVGVFTTSTSGRAFESIKLPGEENGSGGVGNPVGAGGMRKALVVCRVIAGRVHKPLDNIREMDGQTGFDSLAGKVGLYANIEELFLLNPRALLPCFVVVCKP